MRKDPENLPKDCKPVICRLRDGSRLDAANHSTLDSGWLWLELWDGTRLKLPPQRLDAVETVDVVRKAGDNTEWLEIRDDQLVERAKNSADADQDRQPVVADGGSTPHPHAGGGSQ